MGESTTLAADECPGVPPSHKMTVLGPLPREWEVDRFDGCNVERNAKIPSSIAMRQYKEWGKYPIIDQSMNYIAGFTDDDNRVIREQLPVIIFGDHTRVFKFVDFPFAIGADGTKIIHPKLDTYDPKFLYYYLLGVNIPSRGYNRHFHLLKEQHIVRPPLPEQQKIAAVLSAVQEAKEKTEAVIRATRELKKSLMKHLFTYGPVPVGAIHELPLHGTELGPLPRGWGVVRLGDACELRKEATEPTNTGVRYVGLEHIDSGETRVKRSGVETDVRSTKNRFYAGDILYGKLRPYLDKAAIVDFDGICSTDIMVITVSANKANADYLGNLLHLPTFLSFATSTMTGVNHPRTSWKALATFTIPLPPLPSQRQIGEIVSCVDRKIGAEENKKKALEALFKSLLSNLMTGKIRVNRLGVRV